LRSNAITLAYAYLRKLTQQHGGTIKYVSDGEAFSAMRTLAKSEGLAVEPAKAVAFAGLSKMIHKGVLKPKM
jgi:threonine synthase